MTVDEILEALTELFNKADILDAHIIREVCNNSAYFIKQQQSEINRLQQENEQLKELLRLAVKDTPHICQNCLNIINTDNKYFCPLVNATNPQYGGSAQWGKCMWQWQHADKLKGLIEI